MNHHLKGNRGNSEQHRASALCSKNNHLKGFFGNSEQYAEAARNRAQKQKQLDAKA